MARSTSRRTSFHWRPFLPSTARVGVSLSWRSRRRGSRLAERRAVLLCQLPYSFQVLGLLDHDVFPVKRHSLLTSMNDKLYMGVLQERPKLWYLWPGLFFVRSSALDLDNFSMLPTGKADTGGALWEKVFRHMDRKEVFFWEERECRLREGVSRQSAFYYQIGPWIHTVNASYWDACAPKEKGILHFLRKETGITDLFAVSGEG